MPSRTCSWPASVALSGRCSAPSTLKGAGFISSLSLSLTLPRWLAWRLAHFAPLGVEALHQLQEVGEEVVDLIFVLQRNICVQLAKGGPNNLKFHLEFHEAFH